MTKINMSLPNKQKGVVLVICLLLLLVISLVGISNLSTTTLEERMTSNFQSKNVTFQAANASIETGIDDTDFLWDAHALGVNPVTPQSQTVANATATFSTNTVDAEFKESTIPTGDEASSIRIGAAGYSLYHYYVKGTSELADSNAKSIQVQGAYLKGASAN